MEDQRRFLASHVASDVEGRCPPSGQGATKAKRASHPAVPARSMASGPLTRNSSSAPFSRAISGSCSSVQFMCFQSRGCVCVGQGRPCSRRLGGVTVCGQFVKEGDTKQRSPLEGRVEESRKCFELVRKCDQGSGDPRPDDMPPAIPMWRCVKMHAIMEELRRERHGLQVFV